MRLLGIWALLTIMAGGLAVLPTAQAVDEVVVGDGMTVLMEYTITVPDSQLVIPKNVSQFAPGHHDMLPNLEKALWGMKKGEEKRVDLSADDAFGPYDDSKLTVIAARLLPSDVIPGTVLTTEEGIPFVVVALTGDEAHVDFNHPLAGKQVIIDVKILDIEPEARITS